MAIMRESSYVWKFMAVSIAQCVYHVVPGAGWRFVDETDWTCPTNGATWTEPRLAATYFLN